MSTKEWVIAGAALGIIVLSIVLPHDAMEDMPGPAVRATPDTAVVNLAVSGMT